MCVLMASAGRQRENTNTNGEMPNTPMGKNAYTVYTRIWEQYAQTQANVEIHPWICHHMYTQKETSRSHSFKRRRSGGSIVSVMLILLHCSSTDHINTNLEQTQNSMRPELCWNQARGFFTIRPAPLLFTMTDGSPSSLHYRRDCNRQGK